VQGRKRKRKPARRRQRTRPQKLPHRSRRHSESPGGAAGGPGQHHCAGRSQGIRLLLDAARTGALRAAAGEDSVLHAFDLTERKDKTVLSGIAAGCSPMTAPKSLPGKSQSGHLWDHRRQAGCGRKDWRGTLNLSGFAWMLIRLPSGGRFSTRSGGRSGLLLRGQHERRGLERCGRSTKLCYPMSPAATI